MGQQEELKKNQREAFKREGILTEYVEKQNALHMPLTVQRNTSYDAKIRHAQTKGIIMNILGLLALIDIIHDWWVPSK